MNNQPGVLTNNYKRSIFICGKDCKEESTIIRDALIFQLNLTSTHIDNLLAEKIEADVIYQCIRMRRNLNILIDAMDDPVVNPFASGITSSVSINNYLLNDDEIKVLTQALKMYLPYKVREAMKIDKVKSLIAELEQS